MIGILNTHYFTGRFRVLLGISFRSPPIFFVFVFNQNYSPKVGIIDAVLNGFYDFSVSRRSTRFMLMLTERSRGKTDAFEMV